MTTRQALVVVCLALAGCSGSSKSGAPASGGKAGEAGRGSGGGGISGTSGATGSAGKSSSGGAGSGGAAGGDAGTSGATGGTAGATGTAGGSASGSGGSAPSSGGTAGDTAGDAGESAGGTGGACQDLCTESAPACCTEPLRCVESIPACRIEFLADYVDTTYEYADLEEKIATLTGGIELTIPSADIEWAAADVPPSPRFEFRLSAEASVTHAALKELAFSRPFLLSCDDQALFVGVTYMLGGAAGLRTPVLHIEETETGALRLLLGAWQGAWGLESSMGDQVLRELIDRPELRAAFCGRGILNEL